MSHVIILVLSITFASKHEFQFSRHVVLIVDEVRAWVLANDPRTYTEVRQVLASGVTELIRPQQSIDTPTLVITCENDSGSNPDMAYGISSEIDGAQTVIIPRLQHMGLSEQPELFISEIVRFLDDSIKTDCVP